MNGKTIAAIATPASQAGIGIIRISGEDALAISDKVFKAAKDGKRVVDQKGYTIHYGHILDGNDIIDEVLLLVMKGPHSYTAEDTVEIDCHGGIFVMRKILEVILKNGAYPAEPGEFTKRAFLNGRLDLSQAEAIIDIINSKNEMALKNSLNQLKGSASVRVRELRERVLHEMAFIESALDDPEHYSLDGYPIELFRTVDEIRMKLNKLIASFENGRVLSEGVKTVILGKPNAGKSSLMNILLDEDRAIVTEIEGTTRDILEEKLIIDGISLNIVDTAGIRKTEDIVEKIGVTKAMEQAAAADLILFVVDANTDINENDREIIHFIKNKKALIILNKTDLSIKVTKEQLKELSAKEVIYFSAKDKTGLEDLARSIKELFFTGDIQYNDEVYITNARQKFVLEEAKKSLSLVLTSIEAGMPEDFFSIDLMNAYENLGYFLGEAIGDDLADEIFSKFCMGK